MTVGDGEEDRSEQDWELVRRVVLGLDEGVRAQVGDVGVTGAFGVLRALLHAPERRLPMTQLARELSMTTGGFTKLADRMGQAGLIDRRGSDADRRVVYASLTPEGARVAQRAQRRYRAALREHVLSSLGPSQLATMARYLRPLEQQLSAAGTPEPLPAPRPRDASLPDRRRRSS